MPRPMGVFKTENEYQKLLTVKFYEQCPKAVLAALTVSYALNYKGVAMNEVTAELLAEWKTLNANGIVSQKAPKI